MLSVFFSKHLYIDIYRKLLISVCLFEYPITYELLLQGTLPHIFLGELVRITGMFLTFKVQMSSFILMFTVFLEVNLLFNSDLIDHTS